MKTGITLLLNPAATDGGGGTTLISGSNAADLPTDTLTALSRELGVPMEAFGVVAETPDAKATREATEAKTAADAKAKADADAKAAADAAAAGSANTAAPLELSAEQTAWLELRAAAKTEEEIKTLDAQAPTFTDAEWAAVEAAQAQSNAQSPESKVVELSAEAKAEVERQIAITKTEADKVKAELDATSKRLADTEASLAQAKTQPVQIAAMHPLMMADATQLDQAENNAVQLKEWALKNWDGAAAVEASGNQPAQPAYTAEQIRAAYARADKQLSAVIPAARQYLADHMAHNVNAKAVYPEIFDTNSTSHQATESILQRLPGLRTALPSIKMVMGDALVGEKIRGLIYAEKPTAETLALTAALVKADPTLAKFMPQLSTAGKAPGAKPGFKLPKKPIVPLARPAPNGGSSFRRPGAGKADTTAALQKLAKASGSPSENDALLDAVKGLMPSIRTVKPEEAD